MPITTTLVRRRNAVAFITGIVNLAVALTVLTGYVSRKPSLVAFLPGSAPMRLTTAIAILFSGAAVLLLAGGYLRSAAVLAAVCGAVGAVNLVEVIAGFHIAGFDPVAFAGGAPPRAGALIALLLIAAAVGLILMSGIVRVRPRLAIVGFLGSLLHSVGVVAVISYICGVSSAFTTGEFSQLAIHTAASMAFLGAALIRFAWCDEVTGETGAPAWTPLLVGVGALATTFCLYGAISADQESDFAHQVAFEADALHEFIHAGLENRVQPLIRMARRRAAMPDMKKDEWDADAQMILTRGGYQAIEWINPAGSVVWATPPGAGDATLDGNAAFEPIRRAAFESARQKHEVSATSPVDLVTGGKGTIVLVPVFVRDELAGYIAGVFRHQLLFQNLLASNLTPRYSISAYSGSELVFVQGTPSRSAGLVRKKELAVGGLRWRLETAPTEALVLQARSPAGGVLLVTGVFLAIVFALVIHLLQRTGARPAGERATTAPAALAGPLPDVLPVVFYGQDGAALAWNEMANRVLNGAAPRIPAFATGFRTVHVSVLRASASPSSLEALCALLASCPQPALVFDAEGGFVAANASSSRMLGWTDELWKARKLGNGSAAGLETLAIQNVLLMQGNWTKASGNALAATAH